MSHIKKITHNFAWLIVGDIINKSCLFLISILIARYLGVELFGRYSLALTYGFFLMIFSDLGLNVIIIRDVARNRELLNKYVTNALFLKLILMAISLIVYLTLLFFLPYPRQTLWAIFLIGSSFAIQSITFILKDIFHATQKMNLETISIFLERIYLLIGLLIVFFLNKSLLAVGFLFISYSFISIIISTFIYRFNYGKIQKKIDYVFCKKIIKDALPFALLWVFLTIYNKTDIIMLSFLEGDNSIGIYSAAFQIIEGLLFFPIMLMNASFPSLSQMSTDKKELKKLTLQLLVLLILSYIGIFIILNRFKDYIFVLLFGESFLQSAKVFVPLLYTLFFMFCSRPLSNLMMMINKEKIMLFYIIISCILNITLNWVLIPKYSYMGAAYATLISVIVLCCAYLYSTKEILFTE